MIIFINRTLIEWKNKMKIYGITEGMLFGSLKVQEWMYFI